MPRKAIDLGGRICKICGITFYRKRFKNSFEDASRFLRREHCSQSCANSRLVVSRLQYNSRARKYLGSACEACGGNIVLSIHHIDEDWTNNSPENLQTLCKSCHQRHHQRARSAGRSPAGRATAETVGL